METKNNTFNSKTLAYLAIILGWALCGYLMYRSTHYKTDTNLIPDLCHIIFGNSCDKALSTRMSIRLGYPLASWGLAYFGFIGFLLSFNKPFIDKFLVLIAAFGIGFSIFQTKIILDAKLSCPLCLCIHVLNLLMFIALIKNVTSGISKNNQLVTTNSRTFILRGVALLVIIALGGLSDYYALKATITKKEPNDFAEISKQFQSTATYNIPKNEASPVIGSSNGPIQLVVFSSFQCPACKAFAPALEKIHKKFGDKVGITFKNFPLSTKCNPRISDDMQPQACVAAFAAFAAQEQNSFWKFHDQLFQSNLEFDEQSLTTMAKNCGLNMDKWEADRKSEAVKSMIANDIYIGYQLEINATPTVFINGRKVASFDESVLNVLIQNELNKLQM